MKISVLPMRSDDSGPVAICIEDEGRMSLRLVCDNPRHLAVSHLGDGWTSGWAAENPDHAQIKQALNEFLNHAQIEQALNESLNHRQTARHESGG